MKRTYFLAILVFLVCVSGCGYTTRSLSPAIAAFKTIYVQPFKNSVDYSSERGSKNLYIPMMEVKVSNAVINRFVHDGVLKVAKEHEADLVLKGELINYRRDELRRDDDDNVQEYRITVTVSLVLWDVAKEEPMWTEPGFSGDTTYFLSGPAARSESAAIDDAVNDLAQRIIERTVEDW